MSKRIKILNELISLSKPLDYIKKELSNFDWDYDGEPVRLYSKDLISVLNRFIANEIAASDLEFWANLIELREDIEYEHEFSESLNEAIYCLANPVLEGKITEPSCNLIIVNLQK